MDLTVDKDGGDSNPMRRISPDESVPKQDLNDFDRIKVVCKKSKRRSASRHNSVRSQEQNYHQVDHDSFHHDCNVFVWPESSKECLPSLCEGTIARIANSTEYWINEECTSLAIPPSGRHIIGGFTDGTLRLFDTTGRLWNGRRMDLTPEGSTKEKFSSPYSLLSPLNIQSTKQALFGVTNVDLHSEELFDCDSSVSSDTQEMKNGSQYPPKDSFGRRLRKEKVVLSKSHQNFGAVACQIYARGVITSLLMNVACAEDGLFAFGGVLRGSTELIAVDLSQIELYHDRLVVERGKGLESSDFCDILDLVHVYRHSDAKLKGFGSCTRLKDGRFTIEYRLFTGLGIKNMHIWSFIPPQNDTVEPLWQCLYDTPTNGNSINYLQLRYDSNGLLQGLSKSDDQKIRIWDLSYEQQHESWSDTYPTNFIAQLVQQPIHVGLSDGRPKRPPCVDVACTENALGVFGSYVFSGGPGMYNQMSVTCLDVEDVSSPYNHSELALPVNESMDSYDPGESSGRRPSRSGRQQRGDLKSVVSVAGLQMDGKHVVLELSDGSMVHYSQDDGDEFLMKPLHVPSASKSGGFTSSVFQDDSTTTGSKTLCVARIGSEGIVLLAVSCFDPIQGVGSVKLRELSSPDKLSEKCVANTGKFWGFHGVSLLNTLIQKLGDTKQQLEHTPKHSIAARKSRQLKNRDDLLVTPDAIISPENESRKQQEMETSMSLTHKLDENRFIMSPVPCANSKDDPEVRLLGNVETDSRMYSLDSSRINVASVSPDNRKAMSQKKPSGSTVNAEIQSFFRVKTDGYRKSQQNKLRNDETSVSASEDVVQSNGAADVATILLQLKQKKYQRENNLPSSALTAASITERFVSSCSHTSALDVFSNFRKQKRLRNSYAVSSFHKLSTERMCKNEVGEDGKLLVQDKDQLLLARQHHAVNQRFRETVRCNMQRVIDMIERSKGEESNHPTIDEVKVWIDQFVKERDGTLSDIIDRQRMEAASLSSLKPFENGTFSASKVQVQHKSSYVGSRTH